MKYIIFYSWQSDLPNNTNRGFIESVIEKTIKNIKHTGEYELEPSLDRDTQGVPGAPNITQAIIEKIQTCDAFIADISIVTGDKENGKRPSPNPNVLLELGYAIALLGWEKIILFCNDIFGTEEDLPFDIRQHRRIGYKLLQDDPKAEIRNSLAKHFKSRLEELLQAGRQNQNIKQPHISVSWNYWNSISNNDSDVGIDSKSITLQRLPDFNQISGEIKNEIEMVKRIDGTIDPKWEEKVDKYIKLANMFISSLEDEINMINYLKGSFATKTYPITLSVENDGNLTASDIRAEIVLPKWLLAFEKFPEKSSTPIKPNIPTPKPPEKNKIEGVLGEVIMGNSISFDYSLLTKNLNRTSACYLKKGSIYFWADRLLHKHTITNRSDRFFLMALPRAPKGKAMLQGKAFCSEYNDWEQFEITIEIV